MKPVMRRLFPDVPPEHPAMGAMLMNMAANVLGVSNAATPLGLKAMEELEKLNPHKGTATNAMCTFLAINTSSIQLVPASAVAIMVASQAREPQAIVGTALMATTISTLVGVTSVKLLEKLPMFRVPDAAPNEEAAS
jgi:spore maturation protein A